MGSKSRAYMKLVEKVLKLLIEDDEYEYLDVYSSTKKNRKYNEVGLKGLYEALKTELEINYPNEISNFSMTTATFKEYIIRVEKTIHSCSTTTTIVNDEKKLMKKELKKMMKSKIHSLSKWKSEDICIDSNKTIYKLIIKLDDKTQTLDTAAATKLIFDIYWKGIYYVENNYGAIVVNCYGEKTCDRIFKLLDFKK